MFHKPMKTYLRNPPKPIKTYLRKPAKPTSTIPSVPFFSDSENDDNLENQNEPLDDTFDRLRKTAKPVQPVIPSQENNSLVFYSSSSSSDTSELEAIPIPQAQPSAPPKRGRKRKTSTNATKVDGNPQNPPRNKVLRRNRRGNDDVGVSNDNPQMVEKKKEKKQREAKEKKGKKKNSPKPVDEDEGDEAGDQEGEKREKEVESSRESVKKTSPTTSESKRTDTLIEPEIPQDKSSEIDAEGLQVDLNPSSLQEENSPDVGISDESLDEGSLGMFEMTEPVPTNKKRKVVSKRSKHSLDSPKTPVTNENREELLLRRENESRRSSGRPGLIVQTEEEKRDDDGGVTRNNPQILEQKQKKRESKPKKRVKKTSSSLKIRQKPLDEDKENEAGDRGEEKKQKDVKSSREIIRKTSSYTFQTRRTHKLIEPALSQDKSSEIDVESLQVDLHRSSLQEANSPVVEISEKSLDGSSFEMFEMTEPMKINKKGKGVPKKFKLPLDSPRVLVRNHKSVELSLQKEKERRQTHENTSFLSSPGAPTNDCWVSLHRLKLSDKMREKFRQDESNSLDSQSEPISVLVSISPADELMNGLYRKNFQEEDPERSNSEKQNTSLEKSQVKFFRRSSRSVDESLQSLSLFSTDQSTTANESQENPLERKPPEEQSQLSLMKKTEIIETRASGRGGSSANSPNTALDNCSVVLQRYETLGKPRNSSINQSLWSSTPLVSRIRQKEARLHLSPIPIPSAASNQRNNQSTVNQNSRQEKNNGKENVTTKLPQRIPSIPMIDEDTEEDINTSTPSEIILTRIIDNSLKQKIEKQLFCSMQNTEESIEGTTRIEPNISGESQGKRQGGSRSPQKTRGNYLVASNSTVEVSSRLSVKEDDAKSEGKTLDTSSSGTMSPLMFEDSDEEVNKEVSGDGSGHGVSAAGGDDEEIKNQGLEGDMSSRLSSVSPAKGEETELQELGTDISSHLYSISSVNGEETKAQELENDISSSLSSVPSVRGEETKVHELETDMSPRSSSLPPIKVQDYDEEHVKTTVDESPHVSSDEDEKDEKEEVTDAALKEKRLTMGKIQLPDVLLTRLSDPVRITDRRNRYRNRENRLSAISENDDKRMSAVSEEAEGPSIGDTGGSEKEAPENDGETSGGAVKLVFLKPGKSWARSLSILNNIQKEDDIEALAAGKGKNWRESVISVLNMQSKGVFQSCISSNENENVHPRASCASRGSAETAVRQWSSANRLTSQPSSPGRFIRRVSIRVVPDLRRSKLIDKVQDSSFHEAYGITTSKDRRTLVQTSIVPVRKSSYNFRNSTSDLRVPQPLTVARNVVLDRCNQTDSCPFSLVYTEDYLNNCRKIGEGVYGEVFLFDNGREKSVIKIIPIEGSELVNGEPQKKFDEILSEIIIAKELHELRVNGTYRTDGFVEVKNIRCLRGKYPDKLVELWQTYDEEKKSDNDSPSMFKEEQLYIALELGDGGKDLEAFVFQNASEAFSSFIQTAMTLAVAEKSLDFEHRDLHWGNILISRTTEKEINYKLDNEEIAFSCQGVKVSIIDFTLSRMSYEGCCIFNDLALDPSLFTAVGEYQFEIYRLMREQVENDWQAFAPFTNVLWLHYTLGKMITAVRYKRKGTKIHKSYLQRLQQLKDVIMDYNSAFDFVTNCESVREVLKIN